MAILLDRLECDYWLYGTFARCSRPEQKIPLEKGLLWSLEVHERWRTAVKFPNRVLASPDSVLPTIFLLRSSLRDFHTIKKFESIRRRKRRPKERRRTKSARLQPASYAHYAWDYS